MDVSRRQFLQYSAATTTIALTGTTAQAIALPLSRPFVLQTNLVTDHGFLQGAQGHAVTISFQASSDYFQLVEQLRTIINRRVLSLAAPGDALLIEEAIHDVGGHLTERKRFTVSDRQDVTQQAAKIGKSLREQTDIPHTQTSTGHLLYALAAKL